MNTEMNKKEKDDFEKKKFKKNSVFRKTLEYVRKLSYIKLVKREKKTRNYLVSEPNYHTTINMNMNKHLYLGFPILKMIKTVMCEV